MGNASRTSVLLVTIAVLLTGLVVGSASAQSSGVEVDTSASARQVAEAIAADPSEVTGAEWVTRPSAGRPTALVSGFLSAFPRDGADYGLLTSGDATFAPLANDSGSTGADIGGGTVRGDTDFDVTILRIDVDVPVGANCLVGIEFRFLSDEFPEYVGSAYNDAFVLELDQSTWTTSGSTISAPDNFAFDPAGNVVSINAAGETSMSAVEAQGTTYDGATPVLTAATPIDPGAHSIYLSIFDQGDHVLDSAVLVDDLRFGRVADVAEDCRPGAQPVDAQQPLPLLGAHGITGTFADMVPNLEFAQSTVDDLPDVLSTTTEEVGSVWDNAIQLLSDARDLEERNDSGSVNIIAHSKGGLDSRVAMWAAPGLFEDLAMLATPNGGSGLADTLCRVRSLGNDSLFADMGPCDDASDGLYNLQTDWIADVYNEVVVDSPQHDIWIAAGDCMGPAWTDEGRVSCNGPLLIGHSCTDVDGFLGLGDADGENAVCVWSAFAQVAGFDPGGSHIAIDPIFEGLNHTDMRQDACPNTAVLARVYGPWDQDNPWITGDGSGCEGLPRLDGAAAGASTPSSAPAPASAPTTGAAPASDAIEPTEVPFSLQGVRVLTLDDTGVATLAIDDEGGQLGVSTMAEPGDLADLEVVDATGAVVSPEADGDTTVFGIPGSRAALYPSFGTGTLHLSGTPGAEVAVTTSVTTDVVAAADAEVVAPDEVRLTVRLHDASPSTAHPSTVRARIGTAPDAPVVDLPLTQVSGDVLTFGTSIVPTRGTHQSVRVIVDGPHPRELTTGFVVPDGSGSIDGLASDRTVDTDGDGTDDALELSVDVTTQEAGTHDLSLVLRSGERIVGTGPGTADLVAGANTMTVTVSFAEMASVGLAGPWEVTDLVLTRGPERRWVATADSLGTTSAVPREVLGAGGLALSRPVGAPLDADLDGAFEAVEWSWTTWVPEAGDYAFEGIFLGPRGQQLGTVDMVATLEEGVTDMSSLMDGDLVGEHLAGRYALVDLTVTAVDDESMFDRAPTGLTDVLDPAGWTSGTPDLPTLVGMWRDADRRGHIYTTGLFRSELNRLVRAEQDLVAGDVSSAVDELTTFLHHVTTRENKFEAATRSQLMGYTTSLVAELES